MPESRVHSSLSGKYALFLQFKKSAEHRIAIVLVLEAAALPDVEINALKHQCDQTMQITKDNNKCTALHENVETRSTAWDYN